MSDKDPKRRPEVLDRILNQIKASRLIATLSRGSIRENSDTVDKLRRLGEFAVEPLIRALNDPDRVTRLEAVRTLGHVATPDELRPLVDLSKSEYDPELAGAAKKSIARILARGDRRTHPSRDEMH
jgi:HEAT repeat protein